jgi:hypothetical protein
MSRRGDTGSGSSGSMLGKAKTAAGAEKGGNSVSVNLYPTVCNLCGGRVEYASNDRIYGKQYGSGYCYLCTTCGAYVGTHKPWPRKAMGILADEPMRKAKRNCHEIFDSKWQGQPKVHKKRNDLYCWLAHELDIPEDMCHFGYFDLAMLQKAYAVLLHIQDKPMQYDNMGRLFFDLTGGD